MDNIFSLHGKKAVIIGGAGVLGFEIAKGLGQAGADVVICDLQNAVERSEELGKDGIKSKGIFIDVMKREEVEKAAQDTLEYCGQVDILVNAAGGNVKDATTSEDLSFFDLPVSGLERVVALNLFGGTILPCQVFGKSMVDNSEGGSIINISSMNAFRPLTRIPGYSAAKAAVSNFTQWLSVHFAQEYNPKLRVNAIAPGFFLTAQNRFLLIDQSDNLTVRGKTIVGHTPMGRFGEPSELVGISVYLASNASRFVTGIVVPVDGGFSAFSGV